MQFLKITTVVAGLAGLVTFVQGVTVPVGASVDKLGVACEKLGVASDKHGAATVSNNVDIPASLNGFNVSLPMSLGFNISAMTWSGPVNNTTNATLSGTVSQITSQLKALNPDWTPRVPEVDLKNISTSALHKRDTWGVTTCNTFPLVNYWSILAGSIALNQMGGSTFAPPYTCVLAECWAGAGIWLCDNIDVQLDINLSDIGLAAWHVATFCPAFASTLPYISGQQFDSDGYYVLSTNC